MTMLSRFFSLSEACRSEWATRTGTNNTPTDPTILAALRFGAEQLDTLRGKIAAAGYDPRIRVNSAYRSPPVNAAVGGVATSNHLKGEAWDIESFDPKLDNLTLAKMIRASRLPFDELILEHYREGVAGSGWVHVAFRAKGHRGRVLTIGGGKTLAGLPGDAQPIANRDVRALLKTARPLTPAVPHHEVQAVIDEMTPEELAEMKRGAH